MDVLTNVLMKVLRCLARADKYPVCPGELS